MDVKAAPLVAIVDDEPDTINIMVKLFGRRNISLSFVAYNGLEAIDKFKKAVPGPNVIIMDQRMPLANGVEATREILALDPGVKVIFLSADGSIEDAAMESGATLFMKKPVNMNAIVDAIRGAV